MKPRNCPWIPLIVAVLLGASLACAGEVTFPQAVSTGTASVPDLPTATAATKILPVPTGAECPGGDCANACLSKLHAIVQNSGSSSARPKVAGQGPGGALATVLVTYTVNGDRLGPPKYSDQVPPELTTLQHDTASQRKIWEYFADIIPPADRTELIYYMVSTDGKGGMLASVEQFSGQSKAWALVVDPVDASKPRDLTFTLLHEFGHLLTLNSTQVTPDQAVLEHPNDLRIYAVEAASCPRYFASGGCSLPNSYINQFFNLFWTKIYAEWSSVNAAKDEPGYLQLLARFYHNHASQFVTPYSSTSPEEDMAETWAYFILNPKPSADSIAHRKVLFYYSFPELVHLRDQISSNLCAYAATQ
ncbi:MAG TPA: hypothetical protein VF784_16000 [Anaerolineales bacterium]